MTFRQHLALGILAVSAIFVGVEGNFGYEAKDPQDPSNVSLLRQALTSVGIDPNGITIAAFYSKWWVAGYSYKVTYVDKNGLICYVHFQKKKFHKLRLDEMPHCDRREIGIGNINGGGGGGGGGHRCHTCGDIGESGVSVKNEGGFDAKIKIKTGTSDASEEEKETEDH